MSTGILYIETRPVSPEREEEYNTWYDKVHLGEVVALDGFVSARRFAPAAEGDPYVAIYEIDAPDPSSAMSALMEAVGAGRVQLSDAMQMDPPPKMQLLTVITSHEPSAQGA